MCQQQRETTAIKSQQDTEGEREIKTEGGGGQEGEGEKICCSPDISHCLTASTHRCPAGNVPEDRNE